MQLRQGEEVLHCRIEQSVVQLVVNCEVQNEVYPIAPLLARGKIVLDTRSCLPLSLASYHQPVSQDKLVRSIVNCTNHMHYFNLAFPQISAIDNKPACTACNNVLFQGVIKQGFASWTLIEKHSNTIPQPLTQIFDFTKVSKYLLAACSQYLLVKQSATAQWATEARGTRQVNR